MPSCFSPRSFPQGWEATERFAADGLIRADISKSEHMGLQIRLTDTAPGAFTSTAEAMAEDYATDMATHYGGYCNETERLYPETGDEAITVRFDSEWDDGSRWYLQLSLVRKGTMLVIFQCGCPWEDRQEGRSSFNRVVESIVFGE